MRLFMTLVFFAVCSVALPQGLDPMKTPGGPDDGLPKGKLPNGKNQLEEILKSDHAKSLQDLKQIIEIAQTLSAEMEHDTSHVLSLNSLHKTEEIEKIARRIRGRMRKY